jgi:hypothetical protein
MLCQFSVFALPIHCVFCVNATVCATVCSVCPVYSILLVLLLLLRTVLSNPVCILDITHSLSHMHALFTADSLPNTACSLPIRRLHTLFTDYSLSLSIHVTACSLFAAMNDCLQETVTSTVRPLYPHDRGRTGNTGMGSSTLKDLNKHDG